MGCQPVRALSALMVSTDPCQRGCTAANEETDLLLPHAVARPLLLGRRESLTIAGQPGVPVAAVNEALLRLGELCSGCIRLQQPFPRQPRFIAVVQEWEPLKRLGWRQDQPASGPW
jgi:hypothetical protein